MTRILIAATMLLTVLLAAINGSAQALDCHGRLIVIGSRPWEVKERCGEPTNTEDVTKYRSQETYDQLQQRPIQTLVPVQQTIWTYNFGPTRFMYYLTFQEGKLIDIKTGDYGQ
jgi:hypothetical protein